MILLHKSLRFRILGDATLIMDFAKEKLCSSDFANGFGMDTADVE